MAETMVDDAQITFKVKTSSDSTHTMTMAESATVLELKTKLAGEDVENIPVERQRLIYSGRVMKNDDTLGSYQIKANNTIHMVKSAASNPAQAATSAAAAPANMASGTANNPLAGLTGARYAGHQVNLPGMDMFGPDGGMGPPMDEERLQNMMADPNTQQAIREALNNPDFINLMIESNPMLRNLPGARELMTSPGIQQMMSNPSMLRDAFRLQRMMGGNGGAAFPAPGATDTTPEGGATSNANQAVDPALMNSLLGGGDGNAMAQMLQSMMGGMGGGPSAAGGTGATPAAAAGDGQATTASQGGGTEASQGQQGSNPFASLFPQQGGYPMSMSPEMMEQMMQMMGRGAQTAPTTAADNRPPEERYAEQLRQLNDMGFFDFDRNVAALRRSGGSVQGAIEHLLSATD